MFMITTLVVKSQAPLEMAVWPNGAPIANGITVEEKVSPEGRVQNSKEAKLYVYPADKALNTHQAVLICPGGAYSILAINHEGHDVARWLASKGVTGIVLKYRMPNHHSQVPLSDAQEAMNIIRGHAREWAIDSSKVGVCGFSAGGHLASTLSTKAISSARPNFSILFYPVISLQDGITHKGSRENLLEDNTDKNLVDKFSNEKHVDAQTPATLLLLADDDKAVVPENSILYYSALKNSHIAASMHIFPSGGHGFGFRTSYKYHENIKAIISDWLAGLSK